MKNDVHVLYRELASLDLGRMTIDRQLQNGRGENEARKAKMPPPHLLYTKNAKCPAMQMKMRAHAVAKTRAKKEKIRIGGRGE